VTADELYRALRALPITDQRLRKAKTRFPDVYRAVIERLRLEGWITRAQAAL
jgi:hypothetical protein